MYCVQRTMIFLGASVRKSLRCSLWLAHIIFMGLWHVNADPAHPCFQSLSEMKCQHLSLYFVPRNLPANIKKLDLSHNFIQTLAGLSMSSLNNLEYLDVHDNHLETIETGTLDALSHLQSMNLASNRLHKCFKSQRGAFNCLPNLKILNLANNNLDSDMVHCYLSNATSLVHLDLSWNAIKELFSGMFDGVPWLSELNLSNNFIDRIESGTFYLLKDLRVLNLAANTMQCISSFDLFHLHSLNLSSNVLQFFLTNSSQEHYQLQILDLSQNNLLFFPALPRFHRLQHVNLSGNCIAELIPSPNFTEEHREALSWYESVAEVDFASDIEHAVSHLSHIVDLNLRNNKLTVFPWYFLPKMNTLQHLNLAENYLQNITFTPTSKISGPMKGGQSLNISSLKVLDLQDNKICCIPQGLFNLLPGIEYINLKSNNIMLCPSHHTTKESATAREESCSTFSGAQNLRYLNLKNNGIRHLPPRVFDQTSVAYLDLSHNTGLDIQEGALQEVAQSLQILSLNSNWMTSSQTRLPCLKWLKSLDLSNNRLTEIPANLECSPMESLDLQINYFQILDEGRTSLWRYSLKHMTISSNPFDCCSLAWLDHLLAAKIHIKDLEEAYCVYVETNISEALTQPPQHSQYCIHWKDYYLRTGIIIISGFLTLCSALCYISKKRREKFCMICKLRRGKVAPEATEQANTSTSEGKQVCFTVSNKEFC
ncbi:transforming growth factor beta activator LRRC32-like [Hyperolius riggenbachi]|uniref:transforming growth factor beta activator LRRC32-like n=1 Tax=Hyperolius riggenbachi TaxID=752182 RepID=UPI0035A35FC3